MFSLFHQSATNRGYNYHYWKGWPNADDPYVAPYALWGAIMLALLKIEPTGAE